MISGFVILALLDVATRALYLPSRAAERNPGSGAGAGTGLAALGAGALGIPIAEPAGGAHVLLSIG